MPQDQNRAFMRSNVTTTAQITPEGGKPMYVLVKDLSLHGIMVHSEQALEIGQKCNIRILFGHYQYELPIKASGSVVRIQNDDFAIKFDTMGFESNEELESMILSHSEDPEQCLKEFTQEEIYFDPLSATDLDPDDPR